MYAISHEFAESMVDLIPDEVAANFITFEEWLGNDCGSDFAWKSQHELMLKLRNQIDSSEIQERLAALKPFSAESVDPVVQAFVKSTESRKVIYDNNK